MSAAVNGGSRFHDPAEPAFRPAGPPPTELKRVLFAAAMALALLALACRPQPPAQVGVHCGSERWPVKTLSDPKAGNVDLTPRLSDVAALRALPAPRNLPQDSRIAPTELQTFTVTAQLVGAKLENDHDFHVVIADLSDRRATMIVEFPDIACSGAISSPQAQRMKQAREAFVAAYGQPREQFRTLTGTITLVGVGFFDYLHGQTGVAPNGIELHPVLGMQAR